MSGTIRLLVADDHPVVRAGIVGLLEAEAGFEVVAEADSGEQAIERLATLVAEGREPAVVLMDLRMPGMGGVEATRRIAEAGAAPAASKPRVLVFTTYEEDDQILAAIEAGASGYLLKAAPGIELIAGVRAVASGQTVLAPSIAMQLARAIRSQEGAEVSSSVPQLTPRETEILALVAKGCSNPEIATRLFIGESTVKTHLIHVFEKLEVGDRTRAVTRAMELGLLG